MKRTRKEDEKEKKRKGKGNEKEIYKENISYYLRGPGRKQVHKEILWVVEVGSRPGGGGTFENPTSKRSKS